MATSAYQNAIRPACKPLQGPLEGDFLTAVGWGKQTKYGQVSRVLKKVSIRVKDQLKCKEAYGQRGVTIRDKMFCASEDGKDTCTGDSGGPLLKYEYGKVTIVGITSFGIGCAHPLYPGVYTNVAKYMDWINQYVETCN